VLLSCSMSNCSYKTNLTSLSSTSKFAIVISFAAISFQPTGKKNAVNNSKQSPMSHASFLPFC
jgi:hypothetical protein